MCGRSKKLGPISSKRPHSQVTAMRSSVNVDCICWDHEDEVHFKWIDRLALREKPLNRRHGNMRIMSSVGRQNKTRKAIPTKSRRQMKMHNIWLKYNLRPWRSLKRPLASTIHRFRYCFCTHHIIHKRRDVTLKMIKRRVGSEVSWNIMNPGIFCATEMNSKHKGLKPFPFASFGVKQYLENNLWRVRKTYKS